MADRQRTLKYYFRRGRFRCGSTPGIAVQGASVSFRRQRTMALHAPRSGSYQSQFASCLLPGTDYAQKDCSANAPYNCAQRHERKKYQHPTVTFKIADVEYFSVGEAKADTHDRSQNGTQNESHNCENTALHLSDLS